jgi:hypothetical protein
VKTSDLWRESQFPRLLFQFEGAPKNKCQEIFESIPQKTREKKRTLFYEQVLFKIPIMK